MTISRNFSILAEFVNTTGKLSGTGLDTATSAQLSAIGIGAAAGAAGTITATGNIIANSSDMRLKTNIKPIENALDKVGTLQGFTFTWNQLATELCPGFNPTIVEPGVFAQEIQAVLPDAVKIAPFDTVYIDGVAASASGEKYLTVQYEKIVPLLIEAIKELKAEVDALKGK